MEITEVSCEKYFSVYSLATNLSCLLQPGELRPVFHAEVKHFL